MLILFFGLFLKSFGTRKRNSNITFILKENIVNNSKNEKFPDSTEAVCVCIAKEHRKMD